MEPITELDNCILKRWEAIGFLCGLEGEEKYTIAIGLEELAKQIIYYPNHDDFGLFLKEFETFSFPIVRLILRLNENYKKFNKTTIIPFITKLIEDLKRALNDYKEITETFPSTCQDPEAEFCTNFSENYKLLDNYLI